MAVYKDAKINHGQVLSIQSALNQVSGMVKDAHAYIVCDLLKRPNRIETLEDLTVVEWLALRAHLYPNHKRNDWSLADNARRDIADSLARYRETELGQKKLF